MKKEQTTTQKRAELFLLSGKVKDNIYQMLRLADEILRDHEYVDSIGGETTACQDMEAREFSHFGGRPSLAMMIAAYRKNPEIKSWRENKFNIVAMIDLAFPKEESDRPRMDWKAESQRLAAEIEILKAELAKQSNLLDEMRAKEREQWELIGELRCQVRMSEHGEGGSLVRAR